MTRTALPKSKAKTAYGLLSHIARLALAEPKRIRMAWWLTRPEDVDADKRPACGTIGCIGGWAIVLKGTRAQRAHAYQDHLFSSAQTVAQRILSLNREQGGELFNPNIRGNPGTLTHARAVAARIRRFQQRYAAQLKAKAV